jgi:hypothetical protein
MNLLFLLVSICSLVYSIRYSFFWWFQSSKYLTLNQKKREEYRKKTFFMPQLLMFEFYNKHPKYELWLNRCIGLFALSASLVGINIGINGPFVIN